MVGMEENLRRVGSALWSEDLGSVGRALRETGAWPENAERLFGDLGAEEIRESVAVFVGFCRDKGWPEKPMGMMAWSVLNRGVEGRGRVALASERKRRDARRRTPEEIAEIRAFMGEAGVVVGAASDAVVVKAESDPVVWDGRL